LPPLMSVEPTMSLPPLPSAPLLAKANEPVPVPPDANRLLAGKTALHLSTVRTGAEDRKLVTSYPLANPEAGKPDGLYGPKTATTFALKYGIIPPKPFYWPANSAAAKSEYNKMIMVQAMKDAPRYDEWLAAKV